MYRIEELKDKTKEQLIEILTQLSPKTFGEKNDNYEKIKNKKIKCECGEEVKYVSRYAHMRTARHKMLMKIKQQTEENKEKLPTIPETNIEKKLE
jgi:hypothetical protein